MSNLWFVIGADKAAFSPKSQITNHQSPIHR